MKTTAAALALLLSLGMASPAAAHTRYRPTPARAHANPPEPHRSLRKAAVMRDRWNPKRPRLGRPVDRCASASVRVRSFWGCDVAYRGYQ